MQKSNIKYQNFGIASGDVLLEWPREAAPQFFILPFDF
jgi:hypothetical protein